MSVSKQPPPQCELCEGSIGRVFYDAKIRTSTGSIWGNICHSCFRAHGCKLGVGFGQKYDSKTGEKLA